MLQSFNIQKISFIAASAILFMSHTLFAIDSGQKRELQELRLIEKGYLGESNIELVNEKQKAIKCFSEGDHTLVLNRKKFESVLMAIDHFNQMLQKADIPLHGIDIAKVLGFLCQERLNLMKNFEKEGKSPYFFIYIDEFTHDLNYHLGIKNICLILHSPLQATRDSWGNISADGNYILDMMISKGDASKLDFAKKERSIFERIAELKSEDQVASVIRCWEDMGNDYTVEYGPTEEEKHTLLHQSLTFFKDQTNDKQTSYVGQFKSKGKNIYFSVERQGENSALVRLEELSKLESGLQFCQRKRTDGTAKGIHTLQQHAASKMGCIVTTKSYLIAQFKKYVSDLLENAKTPKFVKNLWGVPQINILDIGAANGVNTYDLANKGACVVANDLFQGLPDLIDFRCRLSNEAKKRVSFNIESFPDKFNQPANTFYAVLMSSIIHYLTGPQIRYGIKKAYESLIPGGKLFIKALTPYSRPFCWRAKTTANLLRLGAEWPGWFGQAKKQVEYETGTQAGEKYHGFYHSAAFPSFGHAIHPEILERELKGAGFEIEYINYGLDKMPRVLLTYKEHEFYVMSECNDKNKEKKEAYKCERARIKAKLETFSQYKNMLDNDRKNFLKYKELRHKVKSVQEKVQICKEVVNTYLTKKKITDANVLKKLNDTLVQLELYSSQDQDFSPETMMIDLDEVMRENTPLIEMYEGMTENAPLHDYYYLDGSVNQISSMQYVYAIAKKPL